MKRGDIIAWVVVAVCAAILAALVLPNANPCFDYRCAWWW